MRLHAELIIECDGGRDAVRIGAVHAVRHFWRDEPWLGPAIAIGGEYRAWHDPSVTDRTKGLHEIELNLDGVLYPFPEGLTLGDLARQAPAEAESLRDESFCKHPEFDYAHLIVTEHEADVIPFSDERARAAVDNSGPFEVSVVIVAPANENPTMIDIHDFDKEYDYDAPVEFAPWSEDERDVRWLSKPIAGNHVYTTIREAVPEAVARAESDPDRWWLVTLYLHLD